MQRALAPHAAPAMGGCDATGYALGHVHAVERLSGACTLAPPEGSLNGAQVTAAVTVTVLCLPSWQAAGHRPRRHSSSFTIALNSTLVNLNRYKLNDDLSGRPAQAFLPAPHPTARDSACRTLKGASCRLKLTKLRGAGAVSAAMAMGCSATWAPARKQEWQREIGTQTCLHL